MSKSEVQNVILTQQAGRGAVQNESQTRPYEVREQTPLGEAPPNMVLLYFTLVADSTIPSGFLRRLLKNTVQGMQSVQTDCR